MPDLTAGGTTGLLACWAGLAGVLRAVAGAMEGATEGETLEMLIWTLASYVKAKLVDRDDLCRTKYRPNAA